MRYHKGDIWKPKQAKPANMMDISIALPILPVIPKQPELLKENLIRKRKPEEDHAQLEGVSGDLSKKLKISNEFGIPMKVAELNKPDNRIIPKATGDLLTVITDTELITKQLVMLGYPISTVLPTFRSKLVRKASYDILQMLVKALDERKSRDTVISLSTEFYKNIFGWEKCEEIFIIDTKEKIKRKTEMVRAFGDFQNIETLLQGIEEKSTLHILNKLKCKITPLQVNSPSDKILFNYLNNTQDSTQKKYFLKLIEAFEISRESDKEKNLKNVGNSMLLWHGTKLFNLVSLLTEGLTMPSPEIPELCYSFGRGIYFHDMASKAAEFCVKDPGDNQSYLLLYEVALGNINQLHHVYVIPPVLPKHCNSIKVFGHTAPPKKSYITIDENIQVPLGKPETVNIPNSSQQHNEYIVYDDKQIRLKYLLRVKLEPY
jgi:poly [ADP-ribose] polymerase